MTEQQAPQQPDAGSDQIPYGAQQGSYGQAQPPQNPYGLPAGSGYGLPPEKARRDYGMIVRVVVIVAFLGLVGSWYAVKKHSEADRGADGNISKQGDLNASSLKTGDCFEKPKDAASGFSSVKAIPCDQPHNAQVFFTFGYPKAGKTFPTDDEMDATVQPECKEAATSKVDEAKVPQDAGVSVITPDARSWAAGDHQIQCVVENASDFTGGVMKS